MRRTPSIVLLEVERKFASLKCYPLRVDSGFPPFSSLTDLGHRHFHDTYYDYNGQLWKKGTWLRRRDGEWQMKIRGGGDYINSRSEEVSDLATISTHIKSLTGLDYDAKRLFGLSHFASFSTRRRAWIADSEFKIVLDRTDFGHTVGEVELETSVNARDGGAAQSVMRSMDERIVAFVRHYAWAFSSETPVGKLSAYFAWQSSEKT
ncbi:adenylate cyclase [Cladophialophora yegresii CBS 114405]|uniref:Thiamine-triphosphatase n=1 Tax=Cladophialophora yegresii CBS 114405 TaxID=1182544 RepID=W9VTQ3_9EURO|nr:adenylate cyclase [Cladophialophora yegresii CBS 114405]EXJ56390.1 adenylate cyclase [Cladophialophora yegresii CBS 114405]